MLVWTTINHKIIEIDGDEDGEEGLVEELKKLSEMSNFEQQRFFRTVDSQSRYVRAVRAVALYAAHICDDYDDYHYGCLQEDHCLSEEDYLKIVAYIY